MPVQSVHCIRKLNADTDDVWAVLRAFDLNWHPFVETCTLVRSPTGALLRTFTTTDGGQLVEQRSYISDTDRVLCYTALSGIAGVLSYNARVEVTPESDGCVITWHAEIAAKSDRIDAITEGTHAVFETGLDALQSALPKAQLRKLPKPSIATIKDGILKGTPQLSFITCREKHPQGGTLVLFLHGIGGHATNWNDQISAFGTDYRVAALNLRGYGDSSLGFAQTQMDDYCADILAIADHFGAERLVLVGLSMGSWIATSFAMRHGDKLAGLVLASGCTGMSEADPRERESFRISREVPLSQGQKPADFAQAVVDVIAGPNATDAMRKTLHASMSAIATDTYRDALNCFCNPLETFDFSKITCPVMMITGAHDKLAPAAEIRTVSERIFKDAQASGTPPDVRFEVLVDAGHLCNLEQPDAFNAHLRQFMHRLPNVAVAYKPSRDEKQREKRQHILRAAHIEFCDAGFDGASMDRLAQAADVSKPTLYQYFGDKEGLFTAVLDAGRAHILAPLSDHDGTLVDRLWRFSWTYAHFVLRPDMLSLARLILGEAGRRPDSAIRYHQSGPARAFEGLSDFVAAAKAAGELDVADVRFAANDLWSLVLSGPRDHYLHYVNERPTDAELLAAIGHGLTVFLKAYSNNPAQDQMALALKIKEKAAKLA